jgi:hypothetical protein
MCMAFFSSRLSTIDSVTQHLTWQNRCTFLLLYKTWAIGVYDDIKDFYMLYILSAWPVGINVLCSSKS